MHDLTDKRGLLPLHSGGLERLTEQGHGMRQRPRDRDK